MLSNNNKKQLVIILILLILFIEFEPLWRELYASFIISNFFSYFNPSLLTEILFYLVLFLFVLFLINKLIINYRLSLNFVVVSILVGLIYLYYRFDDHFLFFQLQSIKFIYFSDVVLLAAIFVIVLLGRVLFSSEQQLQTGKGFITDSPLRESGKDLYRREEYAKQLAIKLNETTSAEAMAVGINGEWGIGKTSFFDLLKRNIDKKNFIIVDFNPWGSINEESVIQNFFKTLVLEVRKYSSRLSSSIYDYSNSLAAVTDNNIIKSSFDILNKELNEPLDQKFNEINNLLKDINKRIIIFIDDLDRLQRNEIIQVIKLIRNTANFNNTIFIVAYDRSYICRAFDELGKENSLYYLEKIFQIEFELPFIDSMTLRKNLVTQLESIIDQKYSSEVKKLYSPNTSSLYYPFLDKYIKTLRDVNRFINLFSFQFDQIQNEVSFSDYFNITLLKMKYPALVKLLFEMREEFFDHSKKDDMDRMHLKISEKETLLKRYLDKNKEKLHLEDNDIKKFDNSIKVIFGEPVTASTSDDRWSEFASTFYLDREINSIVFPNTFYRYFTNQIFSTDVSEVEWNECFTMPYDKFLSKLKIWVSQGARKEIYLRFKMLKDFKTRENFEKVIRAIFELAYYSVDSDDHPTEAWYEYYDLFSKLYQSDQISNSYYSGSKDEYKRFLFEVLSSNPSPYSFAVGFIVDITNDLNHYRVFPIEQLDLVKINVRYLRKYLLKINSLDRQAWSLFYDCKYIRANEDRTIDHILIDDAKKEMIAHFNRIGIEYFINSVVITIKEDRVGDPLYFISDGPRAVFDENFNSIKDFVNKFPNSLLIEEFNTFFDKLKESGFKVYIPFEFKQIVIKK